MMKTSTTFKHISDEQKWASTPYAQNCQEENFNILQLFIILLFIKL